MVEALGALVGDEVPVRGGTGAVVGGGSVTGGGVVVVGVVAVVVGVGVAVVVAVVGRGWGVCLAGLVTSAVELAGAVAAGGGRTIR